MLSQDREKGRVALSTRKLERKKGDMLRDPQKVRYVLYTYIASFCRPALLHMSSVCWVSCGHLCVTLYDSAKCFRQNTVCG